MKKFIEGLSLPFFLIIGYLSHILFLFYTTQRIPNTPDAIIIGFLSVLYGFGIYMKHIKKPDAHKLLEEKYETLLREIREDLDMIGENFQEETEKLREECKKNIQAVNDKISVSNINSGIKKTTPTNLDKLGW